MDSRLRRSARAAATALVLAGVPLLLFIFVERARPEPFSTSMDNFLYFAPLIGAQSDSWLDGAPLRVHWGLGAGWTPWQSGQTGILWPLYVVAAALARLVGAGLLELSALLTLVSSAFVAWALLPRSMHAGDERLRFVLALALALAPGPIIIGLSWHNYLAPAPAVLAAALLCLRLARGDAAQDRARAACAAGVVVACALFFAGAHVQMYAIGILMLGLFLLGAADSWRGRAWSVGALALAQLPLLAPLLWFKLLAGNMAPDWVSSHARASVLVSTAVPTGDALLGTLVGTLFSDAQGRGVFFNPLFLVLVVLVVASGRGFWAPFLIVAAALVVPRLAPGIEYAALGPLDGFRWPRKITVYTVPLTLLAVAHLATTTMPAAARQWQWLFSALRSPVLWLALVGLQILVVREAAAGTSLRDARDAGASALVDRARVCAREIGIADGERIALVQPLAGKLGAPNAGRPLPLAFFGFANDAVLLAGLESVHLYEPMEQSEIALQHGSLGAYWRASVDPLRLVAPHLEGEARMLASYGTQWLIALDLDDLGDLAVAARSCASELPYHEPGERAEHDGTDDGTLDADVVASPSGAHIFGVRVPGASSGVPSFPATSVEGQPPEPFLRRSDGALTTRRALAAPPAVGALGPVPLTWQKLEDGTWRGTPRGPPAWVVALCALGAMVAAGLLAALARRRAAPGAS